MIKPTVFDVLLVYTDGVATSASSRKAKDLLPFNVSSQQNYNKSYSYFLKECQKRNISIAFTTSGDMMSDGSFKSYWTWHRKKWMKNKKPCYSQIVFDKFSPINQKQKKIHDKLFAMSNIKTFNSKSLVSLFSDKRKTYKKLLKYSIPTISINQSDAFSIDASILKLNKLIDAHQFKEDFNKRIILKDRYGAGGNNIYRTKITDQNLFIQNAMKQNKTIKFILQPFTDFKNGHSQTDPRYVDVRIIFIGQKIVQSYIRTAAKDNYKCNIHQGGSIEYIKNNKIPAAIKEVALKIIGEISTSGSFFALDFVTSSNGNVYLMEGNSHPGIIWNLGDENDEHHTKKLIRKVARELEVRVIAARPTVLKSKFSITSTTSVVSSAIPI